MKKTTALLLTLIMVIAMIPAITASAEASGTIEGTEITWTLDNDGKFTLAGTGTMPDYEKANSSSEGTGACPPWSDQKDNIKTVEVKGTLVTVGKNSFSRCKNLTSITFDEGITTLNMDCFAYNDSLTTCNLPSTLKSIKQGASYECKNLTEVNYNGTQSDWTTNVTDIVIYNDPITNNLKYKSVDGNDSGSNDSGSNDNGSNDSGDVKTGDSIVYLTIVAIVALCGMAVVVKKVRI